jgi:D-3-phosphoglycerate dehydrogenase
MEIRLRVVVTDDRYGSYQEEEEVFAPLGVDLSVLNLENEAEAVEALKDADGILVNLFPMSATLIGRLEKCRVISRYGVGYDNVDVEAATRAGIWVARVPDYATEDVSDHAAALLLACVRKLSYRDRRVRQGGWNLSKEQTSHRVRGKVLGLVGFGGIARALQRKLSAFGLSKVLVFDPYFDRKQIRQAGAEAVDLKRLLAESDYVSVHAALSEESRGLIGKRELQLMKPSAILVNTARGPLVDEAALAAALREGRLHYAGLDVFHREPLAADSPLLQLNNVILSDHAGWYSEESKAELKTKAARNIAAVLRGGRPAYPVNKID